MVFSSLEFIFGFLPVFLIIYYILPSKAKNALIFVSSIAFYAFGTLDRPIYILMLIFTVLGSYFAGILIEKFRRASKCILIFSLIFDFGMLFLFKYEAFVFSSANSILKMFGVSLPVFELVLPIGISFYVFQAASYIADVYSKRISAERSVVKFGAYLTMFPQLIAGPIVTYRQVKNELDHRKHSFADFDDGLKLFTVGLGLKVILANNIGGLWRDAVSIGFDSISTPFAWLAAIAYSLQLYFDFFGYSLMARGMGRMLGFNIPQNFLDPYASVSMTEFWRRWHMTLGGWFRDYVYIPLGGSRKGKLRTCFNLLIVWMLTGLWHGASTNFLLWGLVLFVIIAVEKLFLKRFLDSHRFFGHCYMIVLIPLSWMLFALTAFSQIRDIFFRLFPFFVSKEVYTVPFDFVSWAKQYGVLTVAGVVLSTPLGRKVYGKIKDNVFGAAVLAGIFALSVYLLCIGVNDPFLYFRF